MALGLYKLTNGQGQITTDNSFTNPILFEAAPVGGVIEGRFYLKMENSNIEYLTEGVLYAVDTTETDESSWFQFAPDESGGAGVYADTFEFEIPLGAEVPVWIKVTVPAGTSPEPKDDVRITASYIQHE